MGAVILGAYLRGARFDGWREHFNYSAWTQSFAAQGMSHTFYTHRDRGADEVLPWDHIDAALKKSFLLEDYRWSRDGQMRGDCRDQCYACGILPKFKTARSETPAEAWECPPVIRRPIRLQV